MRRAPKPLHLSDGEPRSVRFTYGTFQRIRDSTGIELEDFRDRAKMVQLVTRHLPIMIWAALVKEDRKALNAEDVSDLIDFEDMPRIAEELMAAMGGGDYPTAAAAAEAAAAANGSLSTDAGLPLESISESVTVNSGG
jgi:hypothetical protein